jgi:hypothetical protein
MARVYCARRMWRRVAMLPGAALALGCGRFDGDGASGITVSSTLGEQPSVDVRNLPRGAARSLARLAPNDTIWPRILAVRVGRRPADSTLIRSDRRERLPVVIGKYIVDGRNLKFEPRFPFSAGTAYRAEIDTAALARLAAGSPVDAEPVAPLVMHDFTIPSQAKPRTTRVLGVYPSSAELPANLLRWYVELSAPMTPGSALEHVHLLDESGRQVRGAFLALDQELWDPDRRRLTLLFDPGRVKRGVRTNLEAGAPLEAGHRYRLVVDDAWQDGNGAELVSSFEQSFQAVSADRTSLDPKRWRLTVPAAGTREALRLEFGEIVDHALAVSMIGVSGAGGSGVAGTVQLADDDRVWMFSPTSPWPKGDFELRIDRRLEDVAGNSVARVFDTDRSRAAGPVDAAPSEGIVAVPFRVETNGGALR